MNGEKFTLMQYSINAILGLIEINNFVVPEIQRPFVWKRSQVRDLIDSLYNGYPTGYIITWQNPDVRTKDGGIANGKKVLIDGQQRITALMAAIAGMEVLDQDFNKDRIRIAFNPVAEDESKRFAVQDASHLKDKRWIPDISVVFSVGFKQHAFENEYLKNNPSVDPEELSETILKLKAIANRQIGVIELNHNLDIDEVTEIFIRINSKGTELSQSDFVMSKMAADTSHGGGLMRKAVDYFCHLAVKPEFYPQIVHDAEFQASPYIGSPETTMDRDMRSIEEKGFLNFMSETEAANLSDTFWNITLPQYLETSSVNSPAFNVFLAAQINMNCNSMLMNGTKISDLISISGDVHHIFPRAYLKSSGIESKTKYNQVANYIYLDTQVNKAISDDAPCIYFSKAIHQCETGEIVLGNISDINVFKKNLEENCIPDGIEKMAVESYDDFLVKRRGLMAKLIEQYYNKL